MAEVSRPDFTYQWSSGGSIVAPSNAKIQTGWTAEVPPFQWENWSQNRQDLAIVHLFQKGISLWSATQDYYYNAGGTRSFVQGSDGFIYESVQNSTNQNPVTDATNLYWKQAFRSQSGAQWYALDTGTANAYKADYVPVIKTLVDGMVLKFRAANTNTSTCTFTPAGGTIAPAAIVSIDHAPLAAGAIATNGDVWLQWNTALSGGSWVMIASSGGNSNSGELKNIQTFTSNGTYMPTPGTTSVIVEVVGGGGAGGFAFITGAGTASVGGGGGAGAYAKSRITTGFSGQAVTVGQGGTATTSSAGNGTASSFGALVTAAGGQGGQSAGPSNQAHSGQGGNGGAQGVTGNIVNSSGACGTAGLFIPSAASSIQFGNGGGGPFGGGGASGSPGAAGTGPGAGGGGTNNTVSTAARAGGAGANGIVIVYEY